MNDVVVFVSRWWMLLLAGALFGAFMIRTLRRRASVPPTLPGARDHGEED